MRSDDSDILTDRRILQFPLLPGGTTYHEIRTPSPNAVADTQYYDATFSETALAWVKSKR
jgi:hypothetical protein